MATSKEYAYYIKGNKVAIVQKDWTFSGGQTLSQPGLNDLGAQGALLWKSPKESITDGLELQYVYSPQYMLGANHTTNVNKFYVNGWTVIGGYLTFLRSGLDAGVRNWTSSPENAVTSGSSGDTGGQSLDYIVVRGSERWNGLHRVQTAGGAFGTLGGGILKTYTKASPIGPYRYGVDLDVAVNETIFDGGGSPAITLGDDGYKVGDFVHISGFDGTAKNNGVFKVSSVTPSGTATDSTLGFDVRYHMPSGNSTTPETEVTDTSMQFVAEADAASNLVSIAKIEHEISLITTNVEVLNDESFELDVTRGQAKAIVFYMKSMQAEERQDIETREYFMALFRTELGRIASARKHGHYIASGHWNMR